MPKNNPLTHLSGPGQLSVCVCVGGGGVFLLEYPESKKVGLMSAALVNLSGSSVFFEQDLYTMAKVQFPIQETENPEQGLRYIA